MSEINVTLRPEAPADHRRVEEITREAFWNLYCPGCNEHWLAHVLRASPDFLPELDLVAELDGEIVGNIMYARSLLRAPQGREIPVLTFGPVSVLPSFQNQGVGRALINTTLDLARQAGHCAVLIYGDPDYYQRFGFAAAEGFGIRTRDGLFSPALQALELEPGYLSGITGVFEEAPVYDVDPAAAEEFDASFPPWEKLVTATQKRFLELLSQSHT